MRKKIFVGFFIFLSTYVNAQEILARLSVLSNKISTTVDKRVFQTLQSALLNFINNRKWTNDNFQSNEKISSIFL
jgi:hypothetical protein